MRTAYLAVFATVIALLIAVSCGKAAVYDGDALISTVTHELSDSKVLAGDTSKLSKSLGDLLGASDKRFTSQEWATRMALSTMTTSVDQWAIVQVATTATAAKTVTEQNLAVPVKESFFELLSEIAQDAATGVGCAAILNIAFPDNNGPSPGTADYYRDKSGEELITAALNVLSKQFSGAFGAVVNWTNWANGVVDTGNTIVNGMENQPGSYQSALANPAASRAVYAYAKLCLKPPYALAT